MHVDTIQHVDEGPPIAPVRGLPGVNVASPHHRIHSAPVKTGQDTGGRRLLRSDLWDFPRTKSDKQCDVWSPHSTTYSMHYIPDSATYITLLIVQHTMYIAHITLLSSSSQCYAMQSFLNTQLPKSERTRQAHHVLVKPGTGGRDVTQGHCKRAHSECEMDGHTAGGPHTLETSKATDSQKPQKSSHPLLHPIKCMKMSKAMEGQKSQKSPHPLLHPIKCMKTSEAVDGQEAQKLAHLLPHLSNPHLLHLRLPNRLFMMLAFPLIPSSTSMLSIDDDLATLAPIRAVKRHDSPR
ncbi:hypothetical protein BKA82DRAFT_4018146 [Pisolithus tinctorius]|nr:hypothetical protein BKA82DRAFT_4018146 [Pisolithus tinctorius]